MKILPLPIPYTILRYQTLGTRRWVGDGMMMGSAHVTQTETDHE